MLRLSDLRRHVKATIIVEDLMSAFYSEVEGFDPQLWLDLAIYRAHDLNPFITKESVNAQMWLINPLHVKL